jgi:uncharacterized membrane protein
MNQKEATFQNCINDSFAQSSKWFKVNTQTLKLTKKKSIRFASNRSYVIGAQFPDARSPRQILYGGV